MDAVFEAVEMILDKLDAGGRPTCVVVAARGANDGSARRIAAAFGAKSRKSGRRVSRIDQADARPRSRRL
jgi:hypothetical protein